MFAHNVLPCPINTLHLKLVLDILLCTQMLYGWCECWNVCAVVVEFATLCIILVGGNVFIPLVYLYVYTIQLNLSRLP